MCRRTSAFLALLISLLACRLGHAQARVAPTTVVEIQVRVAYANERPAGQQIQIDLLNEQSIAIEQTFTDSEGRASFRVKAVTGGEFRVRASGQTIETGFSDPISISPGDRTAIAWVHVQQKPGTGSETPVATGSSTKVTSASELKVPADAKKAFMKGMECLYQHNYPKAIDSFEHAVALYPQYDAAYDNLGVTFMQLGQNEKARAAFERAVQLNAKNADADRNFARLLMTDEENARAIELLNQALAVEPQDPGSLTLLSVAELRTGDVDGALHNALKVQQVPHENYALAHYVAGRAYEEKHQYQDATAEYEIYLHESPDGPEAQQVRSALSRLTASANAPAQSGTTPR